MSDTITLWFTQASDAPPGAVSPHAEVHINLWRHEGRGSTSEDFLDVGILVRNAEQLGTLSVYLPFRCHGRPIDLIAKLRERPHLLQGVFNEVVEPGPAQERDDEVFTVRRGSNHYLTCHGVLDGTRLDLTTVDDATKFYGTVLTFKEPFCKRMRVPGGHYLRFRIGLDGGAAQTFSFRQADSGGFLNLTWREREYTEIRFNEMRSVPPPLRLDLSGKDRLSIPVSAVHSFLVRDMAFELLAAHSTPHKMRRLEADLWRGYAPEGFERRLERFVVYHWKREFNPPRPDQSVVVFAKFSNDAVRILPYIFGIVLLGATGSAVQATMVANESGWGLSQLCALGFLAGLVLLLYIGLRFSVVSRIVHWFRSR